jgi:hypothetical protein
MKTGRWIMSKNIIFLLAVDYQCFKRKALYLGPEIESFLILSLEASHDQ